MSPRTRAILRIAVLLAVGGLLMLLFPRAYAFAEMAARELPPAKILFGTCAPELDPRVGREALRLLKLPPDRHAKVAGLNMLRLLGKLPV